MFCTHCGAERKEESAFCTKCGCKLVVSYNSSIDDIPEAPSPEEWYYALGGNRIGPVTKSALRDLYKNEKIFLSTKVWKEGMSDWEELQKTDVIEKSHTPPQLKGRDVNNTYVWILAFIPIIGAIIQNLLSGTLSIRVNTLWFVTFILNISLCLIDYSFIKKAGYNTKELMLWAFFLVPVYLFRRAVLLKQNFVYAITWCATFALMMFAPSIVPMITGVVDHGAVETVKNSVFISYPDKSLGQMVDSYFANPKWVAIIGERDRKIYVNISGDIMHNGQSVRVKMQYKVNDNGSIEYNAMEFDGVAQNIIMYGALLDNMYYGK